MIAPGDLSAVLRVGQGLGAAAAALSTGILLMSLWNGVWEGKGELSELEKVPAEGVAYWVNVLFFGWSARCS